MLAAAAVVALVALLTFGVLLRALLDQRDATVRARATTDAIVLAAGLQRLVLEMESAVRGFVLTRDQSFLEPYDGARRQLPTLSARLAAVPNEPRQRALVARLRTDLDRYADGHLAEIVRRTRAGDDAAQTAGEGRARLAAIRAEFDRFDERERAEQAERRRESAELRERSIGVAVVGLVLLLMLVGLLAAGAVRAIVVPVARLQASARELGAGRFGARLPEAGPPETVELAHAFNVSAERLQAATDRHLAELDAVFRDSPLGLAFLDTELRFVRVNESLAQMNQVSAEAHLGRTVGEVTGLHDVEAALGRVVETGEPLLDLDVHLHGRRFEATYFPVHGDRGELLAVGKAMTDVTARRLAEAARERLQAATAALATAVTVADVAHVSIEQAGLALDASTGVLLVLDAEARRLRIADDHGLTEDARRRRSTISLSEPMPATRAAETGTSVFLSDEDALLEQFPPLAEGLYTRAGAYAALPLVAYGHTLGVLSVAFARPVAFDADERSLLHALAAQTAIALARARLYERERTVSQTLQASLLPRALPDVPGIDLAGRLEAGARGVEVGGDFYDAFALGEGAWGLAIGDVCGKGVDAAALTALARHTVRAAAQTTESPAAVLAALNHAVLAESRPGQFLTAAFGRLVPRTGGGFRLTMACGGHPPPVVIDRDGTPRPVTCTGTLLGVVADPDLADTTIDLEPGDGLLLYTDGLTEAGAPEHTLVTAEVATLFAGVRAWTAAETAQACLSTALAASGMVTRDDIALLVAQVATPALDRREKSTQGIFDTGTMP